MSGLAERDQPAGADEPGKLPQRRDRIRQMHQDQPSDHRVDLIHRDVGNRRLFKFHRGQAPLSGAGAGKLDDIA